MKLLPCGSLSRMETSLEPLLATIRSGRPFRLATMTATGFVPVGKPLPSFKRRAEPAARQAGVHENVVAAGVDDDQVRDSVAVQVGQHGLRLEASKPVVRSASTCSACEPDLTTTLSLAWSE